jgi:hypothetical protein
MSITSYTTLKSAIADWLLRDDLTAVIPSFISLAEAKFNRRIRDYRMVKRANAEFDAGYAAVPADWLQTVRFQLNTSPITTLEYVTPDQAAEEVRRYVAAGQPRFFTVIGKQFQLVPSPDGTIQGELTYHSKIPALSDSAADNWLLDVAPDVYLYGALMEAAPYLDDAEKMGVWANLLEQAMQALRIEGERSSIGSSSLRMRARAMG